MPNGSGADMEASFAGLRHIHPFFLRPFVVEPRSQKQDRRKEWT